MKKFLTLMKYIPILVLLAIVGVKAQTSVVIGTGTGTINSLPFYTYYMNNRTQILLTAAEITTAGGSAGQILKAGFQLTSNYSGNDYTGVPQAQSMSLRIQQTSLTTLTGYVETGWATAYSTTSLVFPALGWNDLQFDTPFEWNGTSNLLIEVCTHVNNYSSSADVINVTYSTTTDNKVWTQYQDAATMALCALTAGGSTTSRPNIRLTIQSGVVGVFPANNEVLQLGATYNSSITSPAIFPGVIVNTIPASPANTVRYTIAGPGAPSDPGYQVIYEALVPNTTNINVPITPAMNNSTVRFAYARGIAASQNPNDGGIDLLTNQPLLRPGVYTASARSFIPSTGVLGNPIQTQFNLAYQRDIAITEIIHPIRNKKFETVAGSTVSRINVKNMGVESVKAFDACAIYFKKDASGVYQPIQYDTVRWRISPDTLPLTSGQVATIDFPNIVFQNFGDYRAEYKVNYINYENPQFIDMDLANNVYPRHTTDFWEFKVANSVELSVLEVITPSRLSEYYRLVPIHPEVSYFNSGMIDTSNVKAKMSIYWLNNGYREQTTYMNKFTTIQDIPYGDFGIGRFPEAFIPLKDGTYIVETSIIFPNDPIPGNNTKIDTFRVITPMSGTYTIGLRFVDSLNNFRTFKDAENELYKRGVKGDITFELTDDSYTVGLPTATDVAAILNPAIDFSAAIAGAKELVGSNTIQRTIKFVPHRDKLTSRSSVVININSGIGFYLGQSHVPSNKNSAIYKIMPTEMKKFANPDGIFVIDGGDNKSIRFNMNTTSNLRIPMYLATGASNVTVQNCIFTDESPVPSSAASIPLTNCSGETVFTFADDARSSGNPATTYSSAIVLRSKLAVDPIERNNLRNLDSLTNDNNLIANNEISGFTYGIVSLGMGVLLESRNQLLETYYNKNNRFLNNKIYNVKRSGLVVGFDSNTTIKNNKIFNINGISTVPNSAGIIVGGEQEKNSIGYNSIDLNIDGNEINNITGTDAVYGIKVEQFLSQYPFAGSLNDYPIVDENTHVINNMIWGLKAANANTNIFGLRVFSTRDTSSARSAYYTNLYPLQAKYKIRSSDIINNTIVLEDETPSVANQGIIASVALQNVTRTRLINNAIAMNDTQIGTDCKIAACVFLESDFPQAPNYISDRNAYEVSSVGSIYRLVENDSRARILEEGDNADYKNIFQWQNWTQQDLDSKAGNFTKDMSKSSSGNFTSYRVTLLPQTPLSSILNNFGEILFGDLNRDIDGGDRGQSNDRFDIGACEFVGRYYSDELSVENILEPRRYQSGVGLFADAEYLMQTPPYRVKVLVRNNGTLPRSSVPVRMQLFLEKPLTSGGVEFVKIDSLVQYIGMNSWESKTVLFNIPSETNKLFPRTYQQMIDSAYCTIAQVPAQFVAMKDNVTPRYRIDIELLISESKHDNDAMTKFVRYYVPNSNINMMVTGENMAANLAGVTNTDIIAGRLNSDSLRTNMFRMGWVADTGATYKYDVFDRTGWERRTVDYTMYRSLLWSDGTDTLSRYQVADLRKFVTNSYGNDKRNLIIGSQEMARELTNPNYVQYDSTFVNDYLRGMPANPNTPILAGYDGLKVIGSSVGEGFEETIQSTSFVGDTKPFPGNLKLVTTGNAVARQAYKYKTVKNGILDSTMGIASTSLTMNLIYLAVDWRHWKNGERMLRSVNDFIIRNGGTVVPVELSDFDALKFENRVELSWNTVYELNSDRFEVEKAVKSSAGVSLFSTIQTVPASNITSVNTEYGPVKDYDVQAGNTYIYRLRIVDRDGTASYSPELEVSYDYSQLAITKVTPNPISSTSLVSYVVPQEGNISAKLYDANGNFIKTVFDGASKAGAMSITLDALGLASGAYTLVITDGTSTATQQIRIQK